MDWTLLKWSPDTPISIGISQTSTSGLSEDDGNLSEQSDVMISYVQEWVYLKDIANRSQGLTSANWQALPFFQPGARVYIKLFRREQVVLPPREWPYEVPRTTYTAPRRRALLDPRKRCQNRRRTSLSRQLEETDTPSHFKDLQGQFPGPRSSQHHEVDSFSQDHTSRNLTFTYFPIPAFKTPRIHTLKRKKQQKTTFSYWWILSPHVLSIYWKPSWRTLFSFYPICLLSLHCGLIFNLCLALTNPLIRG